QESLLFFLGGEGEIRGESLLGGLQCSSLTGGSGTLAHQPPLLHLEPTHLLVELLLPQAALIQNGSVPRLGLPKLRGERLALRPQSSRREVQPGQVAVVSGGQRGESIPLDQQGGTYHRI